MKLRLQLASLFTLGLLSSFVFAIFAGVAHYLKPEQFPAVLVITLVIAFNFLVWLLGPYISDLIYKLFYKIEWYEYDQVKDRAPMPFLKRICDEQHMKIPKIGIIRDKNPTAFTYGSASFNARIVFTEGLFDFLDERELEAVAAHELGHIANHDFIIMAIAATLLQILYEAYVIFTRSRSRSSSVGMGKRGGKNDSSGPLFIIGIVSYIFYWIGTYVILFLSRVREYYADEFAAEKTGDPNLLSSALIKIAYGIAIVPDTEKTAHLLNNTRAQGIFDFKSAKEFGLVYENSKVDKSLIEKALLYDLVNPWAWLHELYSTHPLVGKRIRRLSSLTKNPAFRFEEIIKTGVDKARLWKNFITDIIVVRSTGILTLAMIIAFPLVLVLGLAEVIFPFIIPIVVGYFVTIVVLGIVKIRYRYPIGEFETTTIMDCMADLYASPVRGRPVALLGQAIGRGQAGFIFGEDMMFRDKSGIIYLNYESGIPLLGNLIFAWKKLEQQFINKAATASGWFLRSATHHIELHRFNAEGTELKSYVRFWYIFGTMFVPAIVGGIILLLAIKFVALA